MYVNNKTNDYYNVLDNFNYLTFHLKSIKNIVYKYKYVNNQNITPTYYCMT